MKFTKTASVILFLFLGYSIGYFSHNIVEGISIEKPNTTNTILQTQKIQEAYSYLEKFYYGFHSRTETEREDALIDALTKSLGDKHTSYFNPKDAKEFSEALSGDFEGIGAVIKEHQKGIQIMKVFDNSPAKKNNLLKGDIITKIGTTSTLGMLANDAVEIIRGPKGTTVVLTVMSGSTEREISIKRDRVVVPSIQSEVLSGTTLGYIEIGFFGENTTTEFINSLKSLTSSGVTGIIIDGRNNGGGYLDSAVEITSTLLENNKTVVATRGIRPSENITYSTKKLKVNNTKIPVIMIVNNMSASATEILAGALQDYDRALIIGEKTYGKGSVQEPFILSDGSMMKITIAKWFTPKDRGIDEKGIEPDIYIELTDEDYKNIYDRQLEGAKVILKELVQGKTSIADLKTNKESITSVLQKNNILK